MIKKKNHNFGMALMSHRTFCIWLAYVAGRRKGSDLLASRARLSSFLPFGRLLRRLASVRGCLENTDLENADLRLQTSKTQTSKTQTSKTQTSKTQTSKTQTLQTKTCHKHFKKITTFARERIMAAMNLNPIVRLFFFFCYLLFCFQFFQISNIQKSIMKGVIGQKKKLIIQRRKAQIVMGLQYR